MCVCASASLCERFVRLHLCEREGLCVWVRERRSVCEGMCVCICVYGSVHQATEQIRRKWTSIVNITHCPPSGFLSFPFN